MNKRCMTGMTTLDRAAQHASETSIVHHADTTRTSCLSQTSSTTNDAKAAEDALHLNLANSERFVSNT